jgi:hypothetical protein
LTLFNSNTLEKILGDVLGQLPVSPMGGPGGVSIRIEVSKGNKMPPGIMKYVPQEEDGHGHG